MATRSEREAVKRVDAAFDALRQAILDRALNPGARLPAEVIGTSFGMSRTLAREVLLRLEGVGLVEIRPKRGAIVAQPSISEAQGVFDVRRCLEARSVARLCEAWSGDLEREIEDHVSEEETIVRDGNLGRSIQLAEGFHIKLGRMSGNETLAQYIEEVVSRCSLILALYGRPHSTDCSVSEHRMILDAMKRRDQKAAVQIMETHLTALQDRTVPSKPLDRKPGLNQVLDRYSKQAMEHGGIAMIASIQRGTT